MSVVRGKRSVKLREKLKSVKIQSTANLFQGVVPANITLKAVPVGFTAKSYSWTLNGSSTIIGTYQYFIIANNQVENVNTYKVVVTATDNSAYEETISIAKVRDGSAIVALKRYLDEINVQYSQLTANYDSLYNNPKIGNYKETLSNIYNTYKTSYTELVNFINAIVAQNSFSPAEESSLNTLITNYKLKIVNLAATISHAQGLVNNIEIGGRNFYKKTTIISPVNVTFEKNHIDCPNGFHIVGNNNNNLSNVRLSNVIDSNGEWTISFELKSMYNVSAPIDIDICDSIPVRYNSNNSNTWKKITHTVDVENYSSEVYNFIDFSSFIFENYFIRNIKIEKGNKATDWTPAPEDVEASILEAKQLAEQANQKVTDIANDNILSASEKQQISNEWNRIKSEYTSNYTLAINNGISTTDYTNYYNDLFNYITPLLVDISSDSPIVGDVFRTKFKAYYDQNIALIVAINEKLRSGISANTGAINQLNSTLDRINQITSFLGTTVNGNVIGTGVLMVGSEAQSNAGISGLNEAGSKSVRLWAGGTAQNRDKARWQMLDNGMEVGYHSNGVLANERGYNGNSWVFNLYNEQGQKTFSLDSERGLVPVPYIPESYTLIKSFFLNNNNESISNSELDSILRVHLYKQIIYPDGVYKANIFLKQNKDIYEYYNGTKPENASKEQYNGYKENDNYLINCQNGWYVLNQSFLGVASSQQNINLYFYLQFLQDGKVKSTKSLNIGINEISIIAT